MYFSGIENVLSGQISPFEQVQHLNERTNLYREKSTVSIYCLVIAKFKSLKHI